MIKVIQSQIFKAKYFLFSQTSYPLNKEIKEKSVYTKSYLNFTILLEKVRRYDLMLMSTAVLSCIFQSLCVFLSAS